MHPDRAATTEDAVPEWRDSVTVPQAAPPSPLDHAMRSGWRWELIALGLVLIATAAVLGKDLTVGGFRYGDSAAHALDGVLILDWLRAGPSEWRDPLGFAEAQYGHYPALGIGQHYPPGFAMVEAAFFAVFGVSIFTARLCVLSFGLAASLATYAYVRRFADRGTAGLAAVALMTTPASAWWGRQTMLEVPTLAVLAVATAAFAAYWQRPTWRRLAVCLLLAAGAILFKQTAVFLICAIAGTMVLATFAKRLFRGSAEKAAALSASDVPPMWSPGQVSARHAVAALLAAGIALGMVVLTLDHHGGQLLSGHATFDSRFSADALLFYPRLAPGQVGQLVLGLAAVGWVCSVRRLGWQWVFLTLALLTCYAMLSAADYKNERYSYVGFGPLAVFAALGARSLTGWVGRWIGRATSRARRWRRAAAGPGFLSESATSWFSTSSSTVGKPAGMKSAGVMVLLGLALAIGGFRSPTPFFPDYEAAVVTCADGLAGRPVLFSGVRDGDFIFAVRQHLPYRSTTVLRGSKIFYSCNGRPDFDFQSHVAGIEEVARVMRSFAFPYVLVEREDRLQLAEERWLREYLRNSAAYRHHSAVHLAAAPEAGRHDVVVDVYELTAPWEPEQSYYDIPIARAGRSVRVYLKPQSSTPEDRS
jgi:hypothetical protein